MKLIELGKYNVNADHLSLFFWQEGYLVLYLINGRVYNIKDPNKEHYAALLMGVYL